jgi:hypothetical protein
MEERRTSIRHPVDLPATLVAGGVLRTIHMVDLSAGGAQASVRLRRKAGTRVHLAFSIPTLQEPIVVGATVRWSAAGTLGLQFDPLASQQVWALERYFEQLSD